MNCLLESFLLVVAQPVVPLHHTQQRQLLVLRQATQIHLTHVVGVVEICDVEVFVEVVVDVAFDVGLHVAVVVVVVVFVVVIVFLMFLLLFLLLLMFSLLFLLSLLGLFFG